MDHELTFIVTITALSTKESLLKRRLLLLFGAVRRFPGCLQYDITQDKAKPDMFIVFERWDSRGSWLKSLQSKEFEAFLHEKSEFVADFELKEVQRISFSS